MVYTSTYPFFYVTVDVVTLTVSDGSVCALVVQRAGEPYRGRWALPGGFVEPQEDLDRAAVRELQEETGLRVRRGRLEQLAAFGAPGRDPRHRVVSVAWLAAVADAPGVAGASDATGAIWQPVDVLLRKRLAFDHRQILQVGLDRARERLEWSALGLDLVPSEFTVAELRGVYEVMWGTTLDPGNFHRKVTRSPGFVESTGRLVQRGPGRPAELYRRGPAGTLQPRLSRTAFDTDT